jgi:simple sugar transport system permease protein
MMIVGALTGFAAAVITGSSYLGLLCALSSAGLLSLIHAFLSVTLRANQIVSGLGLTIFGIGLTGYLGQSMIGKPAPAVLQKTFIPYLSEIPFLGQAFFQQSPLVYAGVVLAVLAYFFLFHTRAGLNEEWRKPRGRRHGGVNVFLIRYEAHLFTAPCVARRFVSGLHLSGKHDCRTRVDCHALVIFASWDPRLAIAGAFLFGGVDALATRFQALGVGIPSYFLRMLPYAFTILILIFSFVKREKRSGLSVVPAALTIPYEREG